jgi:ribonuclease P protein component
MLARKNRFHGYASLNLAYKQGQTVRTDDIALRFYSNPKRNNYRVAVVISKKIMKSAVKRNRVRRQIYSAVRSQSDKIRGSYDLIFTVYNDGIYDIPESGLVTMISELMSKAKLSKDKL